MGSLRLGWSWILRNRTSGEDESASSRMQHVTNEQGYGGSGPAHDRESVVAGEGEQKKPKNHGCSLHDQMGVAKRPWSFRCSPRCRVGAGLYSRRESWDKNRDCCRCCWVRSITEGCWRTWNHDRRGSGEASKSLSVATFRRNSGS